MLIEGIKHGNVLCDNLGITLGKWYHCVQYCDEAVGHPQSFYIEKDGYSLIPSRWSTEQGNSLFWNGRGD